MNYIKSIKLRSRSIFPALTHRNFRYFWTGQCISLIGTWMQTTGQSWLVLTLTNSPLKLGYVNALQFTPVLIFSLFAGVFIDRHSKRKILICTQSALMILALILTLLVATGTVRYYHILILATLLGCVNTIDMPTRQSFVFELVGKKDLMNGIALNSSIFNAARLIGPAVAGIMMYKFGIAFCFLLNGISFIPVIYGIYKIDVQGKPKTIITEKKNILKDIGEGITYIGKNPILCKVLIFIAVIGIFAMNYNVMIPTFAKNVLMQNERGYGFLMAALGIGSLLGAILAVLRSKKGPRQNIIIIGAFVISILLIVLGLCKNFYLVAFMLVIIGFFNVSFSTTANSIMQIKSEDKYRGRVISVYALIFAGSSPIGSLFTGSMSNSYGTSNAFIICGVIVLLLMTIIVFVFMFIGNKKSSMNNYKK